MPSRSTPQRPKTVFLATTLTGMGLLETGALSAVSGPIREPANKYPRTAKPVLCMASPFRRELRIVFSVRVLSPVLILILRNQEHVMDRDLLSVDFTLFGRAPMVLRSARIS